MAQLYIAYLGVFKFGESHSAHRKPVLLGSQVVRLLVRRGLCGDNEHFAEIEPRAHLAQQPRVAVVHGIKSAAENCNIHYLFFSLILGSLGLRL